MGYIKVIFTERSDIFEVFYIDMFARKRILEETLIFPSLTVFTVIDLWNSSLGSGGCHRFRNVFYFLVGVL